MNGIAVEEGVYDGAMRWLALILLGAACVASGQEPMPVATVRVHEEARADSRLVELLWRIVGGEGDSGVLCVDAVGVYSFENGPEGLDDRAPVFVSLALNEWRRADPDLFVPGAMNALLGVIGVADARYIKVTVVGDRIEAGWERRQDDPRVTAPGERVVAIRTASGETEVWAIEGVGVGGFIAGAFRAGLALEEGERTPSDRAYADAWLRGRNDLLRSLERSTVRTELVFTRDLHAGLVFRFDPAIKPQSLLRSSARIAPEGLVEIGVAGRRILPAFEIATIEGAAVVVVAPSEEDASEVIRAIGGERVSGGDGP